MNLAQRVSEIKHREDLIRLIREICDQVATHADEWPNSDLPAFLEAMAAWIEDMDGYYAGRGEQVPRHLSWKNVGEIIATALIYE